MEWSWRTILILFGLLAVITVVVDGFRRMRLARLEANREEFNPELPSGGARIIGETRTAAPTAYASQQSMKNLNLDEQVPVLLDVEELGKEDAATHSLFQSASIAPSVVVDEVEPVAEEMPEKLTETAAEEIESAPEIVAEEGVEEAIEIPEPEPTFVEQWLLRADANAEKPSLRTAVELSLIVYCIAPKDRAFSGEFLLTLFKECDIRLGENDLFHRYDGKNGQGSVQFSIIPSHPPQQFFVEHMDERSYKGLTLFMKLPGAAHMLEAYDTMIGFAKVFEHNLGAELFDGDRSVLTQQTIEHGRQQIIELEHRQKIAEKKLMRG